MASTLTEAHPTPADQLDIPTIDPQQLMTDAERSLAYTRALADSPDDRSLVLRLGAAQLDEHHGSRWHADGIPSRILGDFESSPLDL